MNYKLYKNFIKNTYGNGDIKYFEGTAGSDIEDCVNDVIEFLKSNKLDKNYILRFNDYKCTINHLSKSSNVVSDYYNYVNNITV